MLRRILSQSVRLRPCERVQLWLFPYSCSRPKKRWLPEEHTEGLLYKGMRGTRYSSILLHLIGPKGAEIDCSSFSTSAAGNCLGCLKDSTKTKKTQSCPRTEKRPICVCLVVTSKTQMVGKLGV